ncbi:hypothetical protein JW848_02885 [Candidatus Bipolaricaulota bacterium]|nr:hypothetical protein [Candidatus Bipolaricaulota bacterium]
MTDDRRFDAGNRVPCGVSIALGAAAALTAGVGFFFWGVRDRTLTVGT